MLYVSVHLEGSLLFKLSFVVVIFVIIIIIIIMQRLTRHVSVIRLTNRIVTRHCMISVQHRHAKAQHCLSW